MFSFTNVFRRVSNTTATSPTRSTPSLECPAPHNPHLTPTDDLLYTPLLTDPEWSSVDLWPELAKPVDASYRIDIPVPEEPVDELEAIPTYLRGWRTPLPGYPRPPSPAPETIAPHVVFADYESVRTFLARQEQERCLSPSDCSSTLSTPQTVNDLELPPVEHASGIYSFAVDAADILRPVPRTIGTKTKRAARDDDDDDCEEPQPKRRAVSSTIPSKPQRSGSSPAAPQVARSVAAPVPHVTSSSDMNVDGDDEEDDGSCETIPAPADDESDDGDTDFQPRRLTPSRVTKTTAARRKPNAQGIPRARKQGRKGAVTATAKKGKKAAPKPPRAPSCGYCASPDCSSCAPICFYVYSYGPHKGKPCHAHIKRPADMGRHKEVHAVHEWVLHRVLEELSREEAEWYYSMRDSGHYVRAFPCPNHVVGWDGQLGKGDCWRIFTRRDALKRHLDNMRGCKPGKWAPEFVDDKSLNMDKAAAASQKLVERWWPIVKAINSKKRTGEPLVGDEEVVYKRLQLFTKSKNYGTEKPDT